MEAGPADALFAVGSRVDHPKWGRGTVQRYEDEKMVLLFDAVGYKALLPRRVGDLLFAAL